MISLALALALAAEPALPTASSASACTLLNLAACADVSPLVRDPGFQAAVKTFAGQRRTAFLSPGGQAYAEVLAALSGPADPMRRLRSMSVFTACADATCDDRGAVVIQADGELAAVAVLHSDCVDLRRQGDCLDRQVLSIMRRGDDFSIVDNLSDWARRAIADKPIAPGQGIRNLDRVEVTSLDGLGMTVPAAPIDSPLRVSPEFKVRPATPPALLPSLRPPPILDEVVAPPPPPPARAAPVEPPPAPKPPPAGPQPSPPPVIATRPAPKPEPEPVEEEPAEAKSGPSTRVESVTAVVQPLAARIPIPQKIYRTLRISSPNIVIVEPPPPPPPPKPKKQGPEMWKWRWTPYG